MKITCQKSDIVAALTRARSVSATKAINPILSTVLLKPVGGRHLQLAATDLEVGYTTSIPARIDGSDLVCAHAGDLLDRVKAMPDGDVALNATAKSVVVTTKGSKRRFERAAQPGDEFPRSPLAEAGAGFAADAAMLATMLEATHFAVNTDASSSSCNLLIRWSPGRVVFAAADGRRMSIEERSLETITTNGETMVPIRAVGELRRMLDTEGSVTLNATQSTTFLDFGEYEFWCRRPEATFPPYESFPAKRIDAPLRLNVAAAIDSINAVSLAAGRGDMSANLVIEHADGELVFSAESPDKGVARDSVQAEWSGPDFSINCNGEYLKQALGAAASESVAISLDPADPLFPIRVDPWEAQAGRTHYGVVMPARK